MTRIEGIREAARLLLETTAGSPEEVRAAKILKNKLLRCQLDPEDIRENAAAVHLLMKD